MLDADFRYVMRKEEYHEAIGIRIVKMVKVLQWRKKVLVAPISYPEEPKIEWTDWQDVRTEEE